MSINRAKTFLKIYNWIVNSVSSPEKLNFKVISSISRRTFIIRFKDSQNLNAFYLYKDILGTGRYTDSFKTFQATLKIINKDMCSVFEWKMFSFIYIFGNVPHNFFTIDRQEMLCREKYFLKEGKRKKSMKGFCAKRYKFDSERMIYIYRVPKSPGMKRPHRGFLGL